MNDKQTIFTFNGVPVNAQPSFWPMWLLAWLALTILARWRNRERSWTKNALVGLITLPIAMAADIGHALAHTVSAKSAGAPMDEILLKADMPRTLYHNNNVPPKAHKIRAIGGPIFSFTVLLLSLIWRKFAQPQSLNRELAEISCWSNGLIGIGSLAPLPIVDGGTLLKWTLVENGRTEEEADTAVQRTSIAFGLACALLAGLALIGRRIKKTAS